MKGSTDLSKPGALEVHILSKKPYWQGFTESYYYTKRFTLEQVPNMMRYPTLRGLIRIIYLTILAAKHNIHSNDERTYNLLEYYMRHSYRRIATMLMWKALQYGWALGEKAYRPVKIDNKTYLVPKGVVVPPPTATKYIYEDETMEIKGFSYENVHVDKERTACYIFQGDEICKPKGISVCEDIYWAWRQLMEDWSRFNIWKDFKSVPPFKLKYPEDIKTDSSGHAIDKNESIAEKKLKDLRNAYGISLPRKWDEAKGDYIEPWDLTEIAIGDNVTQFLESISKDESLMFLGGLTPKRIIEQDIKIGSYAMLKEQADFFYTIEEQRMAEWNEYHHKFLVDPYLQLNTGKSEGYIELLWAEELKPFFLELIKQGVMLGATNVDWDDISKRTGVKMIEGEEQEPAVEEDEQGKKVMVDLGAAYAQSKLNKDQKAKLLRMEKKWVRMINSKLLPLRDRAYDEIVNGLRKVQGKIGMNVLNKIQKEFPLKPETAAGVVQIPRVIFSNFMQHLVVAYYIGAKPLYDQVGLKALDKPSKDAIIKLKILDQKFRGIGGMHTIGGQPELIEERLFYAITAIPQKKDVVNEFNRAFNNYIDVTLPNNVLNELNIAVNIGVVDASQIINMLLMKARKEQG